MNGMNETIKEVYENAKAHGWHEKKRPFGEICSLIHSEISEALEEYRAKRPMEWYACTESETNKVCYDGMEKTGNKCHEIACEYRDRKPEGIGIELIDAVIRILDWMGSEKVEIDDEPEKLVRMAGGAECMELTLFPCFVTELHRLVTEAYVCESAGNRAGCVTMMKRFIGAVLSFLQEYGEDGMGMLERKHEYNRTRTYRHGGKRC